MSSNTTNRLRILIVEGNTSPILERARTNGLENAHQRYIAALRLHAPEAEFGVYAPLAPDWNRLAGNPLDYDAYALTGSGVSFSAGDPESKPYLEAIDPIIHSGKPVIGSCWGLQSVMVLLGGKCAANPLGSENGLAGDITLTDAGRRHPVFAGFPDRFPAPCIHRDIVTELPDGAVLLASNDACSVQAASYELNGVDYVGFQYHPELDLPLIVRIIEKRGSSFEAESALHWDPAQDADLAKWALNEEMRTLVYRNWLDHVRSVKQQASGEHVAIPA